jgi:hypothetical protein
MTAAKGPGLTRWQANEDGSISCIRWNDPSWHTAFMDKHSMQPTWIALKLHDAYEMGRKDQAELMRRAINYGEQA